MNIIYNANDIRDSKNTGKGVAYNFRSLKACVH